MCNEIQERATRIFEQLKQDKKLSQYVDGTLHIPKPYHGTGEIKLIVLGQDPTVKNPVSRKRIKTVLNLDKNRSVKAYLSRVCSVLGISVKENAYATNLYKNFFVHPPTQIFDVNIFLEFIGAWLPLLKDELALFGQVPIITLGEPILAPLLRIGVPAKVRHYWGYTPDWKSGKSYPFQHVKPQDNKLGRVIFPFPHQPSIRTQFYRTKLDDYTLYMKSMVFP